MIPKRIADPFSTLYWGLDWISRLLTLYWILKRLQKVVESRTLLLSAMKAVRWLTLMRYSLPRSELPSSWYRVSIPLKAIGSPFLNLMNGIYLRLAFKYDPLAWYAWDTLFPWSVNWELPSTFNNLRFKLKPIDVHEPIEVVFTPSQPVHSSDGKILSLNAVMILEHVGI